MSAKRGGSVVRNSLAKYRLGLAVLGLFTLIVFAVVLDQAGAHKQDAKTQKAANGIATKLNNYVNDQEKVPPSLAAAGIKDVPPSISYVKQSADIYDFCITYKSSSSGSGIVGAAQSFLSTGSFAGSDYSGYSDLEINPVYHQGKNCQLVNTGVSSINSSSTSSQTQTQAAQTPYVKNSDGSYTVCGVKTNYFENEGHVTRADTPPSASISLNATSGPFIGAYQLVLVSPASQVFDENCAPLQPTALQVGDTVDVFTITSPNANAVSILLKRSY